MTDDNELTPEERALWKAATEGTKRLKHPPKTIHKNKKSAPPITKVTADGVQAIEKMGSQKPPSRPYLKINDLSDLNRQSQTKMKKGLFPIDAKLDLHGLRVETAHHTFRAFISTAYHTGKRHLLIVTGKGSTPGSGKIKQEFSHWINEPQIRHYIVAYCHATTKDGGEGAVYVYTRRGQN